jgi:uncharacterized protein
MASFFRALPAFWAPAVGAALGHYQTVSGFAWRGLSTKPLPAGEPFTVSVASDLGPPVNLRGVLHALVAPAARRRLVVLIHGLGGSADSGYMKHVAHTAVNRGLSTLRLSLRGADEQGWDFYHAGLTADIRAALESPEVAAYDDVYVFGFSLGGHVTLRAMAEIRLPANVRAAATLCPPLDLEATSEAFDTPGQWLYRAHVLRGLKKMYARFLSHVAAGGAPLTSRIATLRLPDARELATIDKIRQWDERIVAPRHGFASAIEYYHAVRASTRLHEVRIPSLIVTTRWDPMVPHATTSPALAAGTALEAKHTWRPRRVENNVEHWELPSGGHVAWPEPRRSAPSLIDHMLQWLDSGDTQR